MSTYRPPNTIDTVIIHCAAIPNGRGDTIEDIDRWHHDRNFKRHSDARLGESVWESKPYTMKQPHLRSVGYHVVVHANGGQAIGRCLTETGAHAKNYNATSIGICMMGTDKFSLAQWQSLKSVVQGFQTLFDELTIVGHRDVDPHKTCPGFDVSAWLDGGMQPLENHILNDDDEVSHVESIS
ncbi:N-acetylmuramoyl-L-alanine amidase [Methylophaga nitratireducenticrescens]|uniref:N-acetylmuramoyl-L-alanine amidase n=1 Tax=Methylophaga nitratireducenticrescens TaxID=754476 RepID=UPI000CDC3D10|nr:N-acetylmuramoyl-L-alanine amidase [Methylophaga nitratireducenticrescens]AUZ85799.1 N-acetylmuramoyl-L-alanine amidase [Methylophaga nitratireducenticrescens]AUZ85866.1 N-acetylmuramoyl-L-alanine amidase [Methylophaga nitratireducenticrescens]